MKQTKYFCNLCREEYERNELYGYKHTGSYSSKTYILQKDLENCGDRHICIHCIDNIHKTKLSEVL